MSLFKRSKEKTNTRDSKLKDIFIQRKQLNVMVSPRNFDEIKHLSAEYFVDKFIITEHMLDVGYYYLAKAAENPEKREEIRSHLVKDHALRVKKSGDPEEILKSGEGNYQPELVRRIRAMEHAFEELGRATKFAAATNKRLPMDLAEKGFQSASFELMIWTLNHPLEKA